MSLIKYANATVDGIWTPSKKSSIKQASDNIQVDSQIPDDFVFDPNKVYSSVRAISARINDNEDGFDREELLGAITDPDGREYPAHNDQFGYRTFIGKNNHIDHANQPEMDHGDPETNARHAARGKILWSWFHDDELKNPVDRKGTEDPVVKAAGQDSWVRLLMENDKREFPLLCDLIESGDINKVSMGCEIINSQCSVCGNVAHHGFQYCGHVRPEGRGQVFSAAQDSPYAQMGIVEAGDPIVAFERNHGLRFFEQSWILETQADPTAVLLDLVRGEPGMSLKEIEAARGKISKAIDYREKKRAAEEERKINLNINGVDADKLQGDAVDEDRLNHEMEENPDNREMDYDRPPAEQDGVFYPAAPFPCSAWVAADFAAKEQDPEAEDLDTMIDVGMCAGCVYNRVDESGAVDCSFPNVVREGGKDPLGTGYEPIDGEDWNEEDESSGFKTDDGEEIDVMPGLGKPPDNEIRSASSEYPYIEVTPKFAEEMDKMQLEMFPETAEQTELFDGSEYDDGTWAAQHTVSITIPSADSNGDKMSPDFFQDTVDWVRREMAQEFGGTAVTNREAGDFYESSIDEVISETDLKVITSSTDDVEEAKEYIEGLANYLQHHLSQYSIEYSIDGKNFYTSNAYKKDPVPTDQPEENTEENPEDIRSQIEQLQERLKGLEE